MDRKEKMTNLVEQWQEAGQPKKEFCKQHGISIAKFDYWRRKQNELQSPNHPTAPFLEITQELMEEKFQRKAIVELNFPSGLCLKIY